MTQAFWQYVIVSRVSVSDHTNASLVDELLALGSRLFPTREAATAATRDELDDILTEDADEYDDAVRVMASFEDAANWQEGRYDARFEWHCEHWHASVFAVRTVG